MTGASASSAVLPVQPSDYPRVVEVWEASVRATHEFVSEADIQVFRPLVRDGLPQVEHLLCQRDNAGQVIGFIGVVGDKIEMLFIHPDWRGRGIGGRLLNHAVAQLGATLVDVNEQNTQAVGFYLHQGFEVIGRSALDGANKPYPLLHMRLAPRLNGKTDQIMEPTITPPHWAGPGWLDEVSAWIDAELARRGIAVSGPLEQPHLRPWSTVLRVPTTAGALFFKANTPLLAHEAALVQMLHRMQPDLTLRALAVEGARGWMLMVDGGTRLREVIRADRDLGHWERLLPRYAELQIELAGRLPELLACGVPDRRPQRLPELIGDLLKNPQKLMIGQPDGLSPASYQRLNDEAPALSDLCQQLTSAGVPQSLHHGDLHDANVFADDQGYRIFDWGDASISHPFFSLRSTFVNVELSLQLDEGAPEFDRLRDAYLEPWTLFSSRAELRTMFDMTAVVSPLTSALSWNHALSAADGGAAADLAHAVPSLLQEYLDLRESADR